MPAAYPSKRIQGNDSEQCVFRAWSSLPSKQKDRTNTCGGLSRAFGKLEDEGLEYRSLEWIISQNRKRIVTKNASGEPFVGSVTDDVARTIQVRWRFSTSRRYEHRPESR